MKMEPLGRGIYRLHMEGSSYTIAGFVDCWRFAWEKMKEVSE
ncbi:hypothetical protein KAM338_49720 [Aeromonas caviae]|nr:hypothetical protein KAM338_49720 [Aeromonas caviae]